MRSTLTHYRVEEFELPATLEVPAAQWFSLDRLKNWDFPLHRWTDSLNGRTLTQINWPQSFARRGFDSGDYHQGRGGAHPDRYVFYRQATADSSLPEELIFHRRGKESDVLQGDLLTYRQIETGLYLQPVKIVTNGVSLAFVRELRTITRLPRAWFHDLKDIADLTGHLTEKHRIDWKQHLTCHWRSASSWAYIEYRL